MCPASSRRGPGRAPRRVPAASGRLLRGLSDAGVVRVAGEGDGIGVPRADLHAGAGHQPRDGVARCALVARDRRDREEVEEVGLQGLRVDGRRGPGGAAPPFRREGPRVAAAHARRRSGRVRQVGPPEPLIPISNAG